MNTTRQTPLLTQNDTIKEHLLAGKRISTWQAYQLYNITCLAQRIHDLRSTGIAIQSEMVTREGKRFSEYWLDDDSITQSKIEGDKSCL